MSNLNLYTSHPHKHTHAGWRQSGSQTSHKKKTQKAKIIPIYLIHMLVQMLLCFKLIIKTHILQWKYWNPCLIRTKTVWDDSRGFHLKSATNQKLFVGLCVSFLWIAVCPVFMSIWEANEVHNKKRLTGGFDETPLVLVRHERSRKHPGKQMSRKLISTQIIKQLK